MKKHLLIISLILFLVKTSKSQDEVRTINITAKPRLFCDYIHGLDRTLYSNTLDYLFEQTPVDLKVGDIYYQNYNRLSHTVTFKPLVAIKGGMMMDFVYSHRNKLSLGLGYKYLQQLIEESHTEELIPYRKNEVISVGNGNEIKTTFFNNNLFDFEPIDYIFGNVKELSLGYIIVPIQYRRNLTSKLGFTVGVTPHFTVHATSLIIQNNGLQVFSDRTSARHIYNSVFIEGNAGLFYNIGKASAINMQFEHGINSLIGNRNTLGFSEPFYNIKNYLPMNISVGYSKYLPKKGERKTKKSKKLKE